MSDARAGHGWWPYLGPYLGFGLIGALAERLPESAGPAMLVLKPAVTAGLIYYFWRHGGYPELRGYAWRSPWVLVQTTWKP